jgi:hypothetical protein
MSHSKDEVYTVIIRGGPGGTRLSGTSTNGVYYVDWQNVLPKKWSAFKLTTQFSGNTIDTGVGGRVPAEDFVIVESNALTRPHSFDNRTQTRSNVLCFADIILSVNAVQIYHKGSLEYTVNYPTENTFNIQLTTINGVIHNNTKFTDWILIMYFKPLE